MLEFLGFRFLSFRSSGSFFGLHVFSIVGFQGFRVSEFLGFGGVRVWVSVSVFESFRLQGLCVSGFE